MSASTSSSAPGSSPCDHSTIIQEASRAHELTAQLRAVVLSSPANDPASRSTCTDLFRDVFLSLNLILEQLQPRSLPDQAVGSDEGDERKGCIKRRKRKPANAWTITTTVPHHDGHQWRKYGQKHICNSRFPRCYYRCVYRKEQGCIAAKTVQRDDGDQDPAEYTVSFCNQHTCRIAETGFPVVVDSGSCKASAPSSSSERKKKSFLANSQQAEQAENRGTDSLVGEHFQFDEEDFMASLLDDDPIPMDFWDFGTEGISIDALLSCL